MGGRGLAVASVGSLPPLIGLPPSRRRHNAPIRGQIGGSAVAWGWDGRHLIGEIIRVDAVKAYSLPAPVVCMGCVSQVKRVRHSSAVCVLESLCLSSRWFKYPAPLCVSFHFC